MIRFRDLSDQTSVELIDRDDLSTMYGEGAAIEAVTMSVVDEPVTRGEVTRALPWLAEWGGALIRPVPGGPRTLAHRINDRDFIRREGDD